MFVHSDRKDYIQMVTWLSIKQGISREKGETQEQFVLRVFQNILFVLFPSQKKDPIRHRFRSKAQVKPGAESMLLWATGGEKQEPHKHDDNDDDEE